MARKGRNWRNIVEKGKEHEMRGRIVEVGIPLWNRTGFKRHIQFKAGKMYVIDNMVYPDPRKGLVFIDQDAEHVMHFCWMERDGLGRKETDLTPDPYDASFARVSKCTTGRVYLLKIGSTRQNHFFWMQEPSEDKDAEICNRVNYLLNFPPLRLRFPQIACNFEMPQGFRLPPNEGNNVNADESNDDTIDIEGPSSNPHNNDELGRTRELLLMSTMRNPARNPDISNTTPSEVSRPILDTADLTRQLDGSERDTNTIEGSTCSSTAMKLRTLIPTLKNLGFSNRIIDAAVKGDWRIFINALSQEDNKLECMDTDTDCFRRLKSILFSRDPHTHQTTEALTADIDKIVGALAECNIEDRIANENDCLENGKTGGNQRSVDRGTGISSGNITFNRIDEQGTGQINAIFESKHAMASKEEEQVPSTRVLMIMSSKNEGQIEEDLNNEVVPGITLEQEQEPDNANWSVTLIPTNASVSSCGTQTEGPEHQSKTSLCNRVSRKVFGKSTASLDGSKGQGSNPEHSNIGSSKQSRNRSVSFTLEESLNQPGCSSFGNPEPIGLLLKRDGATNTDYLAELLDYCKPTTSNHGSIDTVDISSEGSASLNNRTNETIEPTFIMSNANTGEVVQCLPDTTKDGTSVLAIQKEDDSGKIPGKSRSKSKNHEKLGNSSKEVQDLDKSSPVQKCGGPNKESGMPTRIDESCPSPDLTKVSSSEDVVFVRGPYYESPAEQNESVKNDKMSRRRLQEKENELMRSGGGKREGGPRLEQPMSKKARISSPEPHPPPPFRSPDQSSVQSETIGRRYPRSKKSSNLPLTVDKGKEAGNSSRKRSNDSRPSESDEPPIKKSRISNVSSSSLSNSRTSKTRMSEGSRTPTPHESNASETSQSVLRTPRALKQSESKALGASSRKGGTSHCYNLRSRSTEQETRPEVDSEQQTEPVRIREIKKAGPETRLRTISRTPRAETMTNRDRSQNTEPVLVEDISKPKDRKPPDSNKKPGA